MKFFAVRVLPLAFLACIVSPYAAFAQAPAAGQNVASPSKRWSIDDDRSADFKHGLFEIREEARAFVARENAAKGTKWEALEPNLKIFVPRCALPLKTKWASKDRGLSSPSVMVICEKTVADNHSKSEWNVLVPVTLKQ